MKPLPDSVLRHLERAGLDPERCVAISFAADWTLLSRSGAEFSLGLSELSDERVTEAFRDVCIGLSRVRGSFLPQVELPTGGVADLHLVGESDHFHAVLLDVRSSVEQARAHQQALQECKLELYERKREVLEGRARWKRTLQELTQTQTELALMRQRQLHQIWQEKAVRRALELELAGLSARPETLPLVLSRVKDALNRLAPVAQPTPSDLVRAAAPGARESTTVDLEAMTDRVASAAATLARERGLGFELRTERRSNSTLKLPVELVESIVLSAVTQALWRSSQGRVEAQLRWDGAVLRLTVADRGPELDNRQRQHLWEQRLPALGDPADAISLFSLGYWLNEAGGRATVEVLKEGGNQLTLSLAQRQSDGEVTERIAAGGRVWLCGWTAELEVELLALLDLLGFHVETRVVDAALAEAALLHPPDALLLGMARGEAARLAYKLKGRGFGGRLVALATAEHAASGAQSGFDGELSVPLVREELLRAVRGPGR